MNIDNQTEYWNKVAEVKTFTHPIDFKLLSDMFPSDSYVVDFGCGYGHLLTQLHQQGFINAQGYDSSIELVNRGLALGCRNIYHISTPDALPVPDATVDCILLIAVLTCIPSNHGQLSLLSVLFNKLKPGGVLYISDYYIMEDLSEVGRYSYLNNDPDNFGVFTLPEGATFRHHTREWIQQLVQSYSIEQELMINVTTMNGHAAPAFQMILRKPR